MDFASSDSLRWGGQLLWLCTWTMILTPCWCEAFGFWLVGIHPTADFSPDELLDGPETQGSDLQDLLRTIQHHHQPIDDIASQDDFVPTVICNNLNQGQPKVADPHVQ